MQCRLTRAQSMSMLWSLHSAEPVGNTVWCFIFIPLSGSKTSKTTQLWMNPQAGMAVVGSPHAFSWQGGMNNWEDNKGQYWQRFNLPIGTERQPQQKQSSYSEVMVTVFRCYGVSVYLLIPPPTGFSFLLSSFCLSLLSFSSLSCSTQSYIYICVSSLSVVFWVLAVTVRHYLPTPNDLHRFVQFLRHKKVPDYCRSYDSPGVYLKWGQHEPWPFLPSPVLVQHRRAVVSLQKHTLW